MNRRAPLAILLLALLVVGSFAVYLTYYTRSSPSCQSIQVGSKAQIQTIEVNFGAVTEYNFSGPNRWLDAVTTAPDGSVWFAEQGLPGVGHLFPNNGTVISYAWPGYPALQPPFCTPTVSVSGIALWNGLVWAADEYGNSIVGLSPSDGSIISFNTTGIADYPYWVAAGPDGSLWFTSDNTPAALGRITPDLNMSVISLAGLGQDEPLQLDFVNSTLAYLSTINESPYPKTGACICNGYIYAFDPSAVSATITPTLIGSGFNLVLPTSVAYLGGNLWVAQHGASSLESYSLADNTWTAYPTSVVPWSDVTLPLVTEAANGGIWLNEHYANKISFLNPATGTLTEYSEADPPISNYTEIQNDLSISTADGGVWFTSMSGNYVGFVNGSYNTGLAVSASEGNGATLSPGGSAFFTLKVVGAWSAPMSVGISDSENITAVPKLIQIEPSTSVIPVGASPYTLGVKVTAGESIQPGEYTVAITVTDGLVQQTAYLFVTVK